MDRIVLGIIFVLAAQWCLAANPLTSAPGYKHRSKPKDIQLELAGTGVSLEDAKKALVNINKAGIDSAALAKAASNILTWGKNRTGVDPDNLDTFIAQYGTFRTQALLTEHLNSIIADLSRDEVPCFRKDGSWFERYFCKQVFSFDQQGLEGFGGAALGVGSDARSIKLNAWQMDLGLSETWRIPFNVYISDVPSIANQEDANIAKLLDLEQGKLNFMATYIIKFRINELCNFPTGRYGCYGGLQAGARYSEFEVTAPSTATSTNADADKEDAFGAYVKLGANVLLPLYTRNQDDLAGTLAISGGYAYYQQNIDDSAILFPSIKDDAGNPIQFDNEYAATHLSMELNITNQLIVGVRYYNPSNDTGLPSTTLMEITYSAATADKGSSN